MCVWDGLTPRGPAACPRPAAAPRRSVIRGLSAVIDASSARMLRFSFRTCSRHHRARFCFNEALDGSLELSLLARTFAFRVRSRLPLELATQGWIGLQTTYLCRKYPVNMLPYLTYLSSFVLCICLPSFSLYRLMSTKQAFCGNFKRSYTASQFHYYILF